MTEQTAPAFHHRDSKALARERDVPSLIEALDHPDVKTSALLRGRVVEELGDLADPRAVPSLVQVLESDPDTGPRMHAAAALGKVKDARSLPVLRHAAADSERSIRLWAIRSIGLVQDRGSVDHLINCLGDEDSWTRECAAQALGRIGDHRATPVLIDRLDDHHARVRKAAASALVTIGDWNALEPLRQSYSRTGVMSRRTLKRAVRELEDRFR
jgi:HEAT repeat protein